MPKQPRARARYDYGAVTQETRRPVPSPSHVAHNARVTPPEKARRLRTTHDHDHNPLMMGSLFG
jgi:hypothetical protein